jgi:phosphinothricin acetyltransferase
MSVTIRPMAEIDWPAVSEIYRQGIDTGHATFETEVPAWEDWNGSHLKSGRLVAEVDGRVVAWAALTPVSDRCVYGGVAETSVYVGSAGRGRGVGTRLLRAAIIESEQAGLWSLEAQTFPENAASIALHKKCGFREVGTRSRVGKMSYGAMKGAWRDVVLLQRRSETVGV